MIKHIFYDIYSQLVTIEKRYKLFNKGKIDYFEDENIFLYRTPDEKKVYAYCSNIGTCCNVTNIYTDFVKNSIDSDKNITYNDFEMFKLHANIVA